MERIYVAGFDVFYPDWKEKRYFEYRELCAGYGFEMQAQKAAPNEGKTLGEQIFLKNIHAIESCQYVAANLNTFRGKEPDSGTCFEIGYAYALGKKYTDIWRMTGPCLKKWERQQMRMDLQWRTLTFR